MNLHRLWVTFHTTTYFSLSLTTAFTCVHVRLFVGVERYFGHTVRRLPFRAVVARTVPYLPHAPLCYKPRAKFVSTFRYHDWCVRVPG